MPHQATRRQFLQTTAAAGIGFWVAGGVQAAESKSPNEKIAMASIGVGGKGDSDSDDAGRAGDMVAICDVDENTLNDAGETRFPKAKQYTDFRKMLDEMGKSIDAVTVSTPDHMPRPGRADGHADGQALLLPEAADAHDLRSPPDGRGRQARRRSPRRWATRARPTTGLRKAAAMIKPGVAGQRQGSPRLDQPADLAAGRRSARRPSRCPPNARIGTSGSARRPSGPTPTAITRSPGAAGGISAPAPWATWPATPSTCPSWRLDLREPDLGPGRDLGPQQGQLSEVVDHQLRVPGQRLAPGREVHLVRRRQDGPTRTCSTARSSNGSGCLDRRRQGQALLAGRLRRGVASCSATSTSPKVEFAESPGHFEEWVRRHQGRQAGHVELPRLRRRPDRDDPAGQPGRLGRRHGQGREGRVGRQEPQVHERRRPRSRSSSRSTARATRWTCNGTCETLSLKNQQRLGCCIGNAPAVCIFWPR